MELLEYSEEKEKEIWMHNERKTTKNSKEMPI